MPMHIFGKSGGPGGCTPVTADNLSVQYMLAEPQTVTPDNLLIQNMMAVP